MTNNASIHTRFWSKVGIRSKEECWDWKGALHGTGYGMFWLAEKFRQAHRVAYALSYGEFDSSLFVCHKCDNRKCCNPFHLFLGTHTDNMQDMVSKGRHPSVKRRALSNSQVEQVRYLRSNKYSISEIAKIFNVKEWAIYKAGYIGGSDG